MGESYIVKWEITHSALVTLCGWTPFAGMQVYGHVREVWIRGTLAYDGEHVKVKRGFGVNIFR
ncbi:MAG: hypothetical protein ACOYL5_04080 [Phototrophicaceae bacterium]